MGLETIEGYANESETVKYVENTAVSFMDGLTAKIDAGVNYTKDTGSSVLSTLISYTPLSCLGI
jgi:hypothetical protein